MTQTKTYGEGVPPVRTEKPEVRRIESDIDETRDVISEDLQAIGEKLSPENLKAEAKQAGKDMLREKKDETVNKMREAKESAVESLSETVDDVRQGTRRASRTSMHFARENALPLAFIGIGAAWLASKSRHTDGDGVGWSERRGRGLRESERSYPVEERMRARARQTRQDLGEMRARVGSAVGDATERAEHAVKETSSRARQTVDEEYHRARETSREMLENKPLLLGLAAIAAGLGVGLLLPMSEKEREAMGASRDRLVGEAKGMASQAKQLARDVAKDTKQVAEELVTH